jgi:hypothetical protein
MPLIGLTLKRIPLLTLRCTSLEVTGTLNAASWERLAAAISSKTSKGGSSV